MILEMCLICGLLGASPEAIRVAQEGLSLAQGGDIPGGLAKLEQAHQLAPEDASILYNVAQLRDASGDGAGALAAYELYLSLAPDAPDEDAVRQRLRALRRKDNAPSGPAKQHVLKGNVYFQQKRFAEAEAEFAEAIRLSPRWAAPMFNRGLALEALGRPQEALAQLQALLPIADRDEQADLENRIATIEVTLADQQKVEAQKAQQEQARLEKLEQDRLAEIARQEAEARAAVAKKEQDRIDKIKAEVRAHHDRLSGRRGLGVALGILGGAFAGGAVAACVAGANSNAAVRSGGFRSTPDIESQIAAGQLFNTLGTIGVIAGASSLAGGTALYLFNGDSPSPYERGVIPPTPSTDPFNFKQQASR